MYKIFLKWLATYSTIISHNIKGPLAVRSITIMDHPELAILAPARMTPYQILHLKHIVI